MNILILSDEKPGHLNQSLGLAEAILRRTPTEIDTLTVKSRSILATLKSPPVLPNDHRTPDLLIGAGHRVHASLLYLSKRWSVPSVVLMMPTLPTRWFDLCLIPRHDFKVHTAKRADNTITTRGALNRSLPPSGEARAGGLILLGGPSKNNGWDCQRLISAIGEITASQNDWRWVATDSRRTPVGELSQIAEACPLVEVFPNQSTGMDWLPKQLAKAAEIWVTEDSVSMIYEALSSGAKVGLLPLPAKASSSRVSRGLTELLSEGSLIRFDEWQGSRTLAPPPKIFREADRCAGLVLERLFPTRVQP